MRGLRPLEDHVRDLPAGVVLGAEHLHQVGELVGLFEAGEEVVLLQLLVVVLDEAADDLRRLEQGLGREVLLRVQAPQDLVVHEHHPLQHAVLAHEVLGGGHLFLPFGGRIFLGLGLVVLTLILGGRRGRERGDEKARAGDAGDLEELAPGSALYGLHGKLLWREVSAFDPRGATLVPVNLARQGRKPV